MRAVLDSALGVANKTGMLIDIEGQEFRLPTNLLTQSFMELGADLVTHRSHSQWYFVPNARNELSGWLPA